MRKNNSVRATPAALDILFQIDDLIASFHFSVTNIVQDKVFVNQNMLITKNGGIRK